MDLTFIDYQIKVASGSFLGTAHIYPGHTWDQNFFGSGIVRVLKHG